MRGEMVSFEMSVGTFKFIVLLRVNKTCLTSQLDFVVSPQKGKKV